jgi:hypothetical protein
VAPTLAEWAQIDAALLPPVDGQSLARAASGEEALARDAILLEQWNPRGFAGVRTATWKYTRYETGERELYDLVDDAAELTNVVDANPVLEDQLEQRIVDLGGSVPQE